MVQGRGVCDGTRCRSGEEWLDWGCTLKIELARFA